MEKKRSVPAAILLSIAMPGLGHLYCGRLVWAFVFWPLAFAGWAVFLITFGLAGMELKASYPAFMSASFIVWVIAAIHAGICARKADPAYKLKTYNVWYFYLLLWLACFSLPNWGFMKLVQGELLSTYVLGSDNMRPALLPGDGIMIDQRSDTRARLERGAVFAVRDPVSRQVLILRLVGLGGETVELTAEGLFIDGSAIDASEKSNSRYQQRNSTGEWVSRQVVEMRMQLDDHPVTVYIDPRPEARRTGRWELGPDQLLLLGDNLLEAGAVNLGPVSPGDLIGRALLVRWSKDPHLDEWRKQRRRMPIP